MPNSNSPHKPLRGSEYANLFYNPSGKVDFFTFVILRSDGK